MAKKPKREFVEIRSASLDDKKGDKGVRGWIPIPNLEFTHIDSYQREAPPDPVLQDMVQTLLLGDRLPDAELNMRGSSIEQVEPGTYRLYDPVVIVDGQRRKLAHQLAFQRNPEMDLRYGAFVHINKSIEWERDWFESLNRKQDPVKPQVLLRSRAQQEGYAALTQVYALSENDKTWAMYRRIQWTQDRVKIRSELINAWTLCKLILRLHGHKVLLRGNQLPQVLDALKECETELGINTFRSNIRTFFEAIDKAWGIGNITPNTGAPFFRNASLLMLTRHVSQHHNYWRGPDEKQLEISADMVARWKNFNWWDQLIMHELTKSTAMGERLELRFIDAVDKRKRDKLRRRKLLKLAPEIVDDELEESGEEEDAA